MNSLINETLQAVVPRVFSDAKGTVGFAETGNEYERARYRLRRLSRNTRIAKSSPPGYRLSARTPNTVSNTAEREGENS